MVKISGSPLNSITNRSEVSAGKRRARDQDMPSDSFMMVPLKPRERYTSFGAAFSQSGAHRGGTVVVTQLPPLVAPKPAYTSEVFRSIVCCVQVSRARAAYAVRKSDIVCTLKASPNKCPLEPVLRERAGNALVRLDAAGLVKTGAASGEEEATAILGALRRGNVLDAFNQVSRGRFKEVTTDQIDAALAPLTLSNQRRGHVINVIEVAKFLYDFGISEGSHAFGIDLCCNDWSFARTPTWEEWAHDGMHILKNSTCDLKKLAKERLAKLSA